MQPTANRSVDEAREKSDNRMPSTSFVGWSRLNQPWLLAVAVGWLLWGTPTPLSEWGSSVQAAAAVPGPDVDGPQMAEELRGYSPGEDLEVAATLSIREKGKLRRLLPLKIQTIVATNGWFSRYTLTVTSGPEKGATEVLEVRRSGDRPPTYARRRTAVPLPAGSAVEPLVEVAAGESSMRFGGSDFSLADLGLEFLFWPEQKITGRETRRTRDCYVLESRRKEVPQVSGAYAKVRSWVDLKTRQFVRAEAYDAAGVRVKMFKPDEFVYYKGRWQVKQLAIESPGIGSESYILFNFRDRETGDASDTKPAATTAESSTVP